MIQKEKLTQFYFNQYKENSKAQKKKNHDGRKGYEKRIRHLSSEMKNVRTSKLSTVRLEDYHRQTRNITYYAFQGNNQIAIMEIQHYLLPELVRLDLELLTEEERELLTEKFLGFLRTESPFLICKRTLKDACRFYSEFGIKKEIIGLVPFNPEKEFAEARRMERRFILHIGPTNCGKTYHALERLKEAGGGVYLGPLRLLALEVYEKMKESGIPATMLTGEECIADDGSRITASTIEMLDLDQSYEVAVIDEAQMIVDSDRGHSWTRAILGVRAKEIHVCMSPAAEQVVTHLISLCQDSFEIRRYERMTALECEDVPFVFPKDVAQGDALIVFTKRAVLDIAGRLEKEGIHSSVIYGSLPPEIRRRQMQLFLQGKTRVVVSTDAIGMGLNLPVRRIVFIQTEKFDGKETRPLIASEVHQIAGRAGRFGMYDTGYVNAMGEQELNHIRARFYEIEPVVDRVSLGFPQVLLDMEENLDTILKIWKSVEPNEPFEKISIEEILFLYEKAYRARNEIDGFDDKHTLFRLLTCSIDIKNRDIVDLWLYYCRTYTADISLHFPALSMCTGKGLMRYETYYKLLDLYHQFSVRMGKNMELERLNEMREKTEDKIMQLLAKDKKDYIRKCKYCGMTLPVGYAYRICAQCHKEIRYQR